MFSPDLAVAKRIISTVGLWALIIGIVYVFRIDGAVWCLAIVAVASQHELYVMFEKMGKS